jgi:signal transduction histidine kinase
MASGGDLVSELRSYVGLTLADEEMLAGFLPVARPYFAAIADDFYAVIRLHAGALAVLEDERQVRRLHASLQVWLGELLAGPYDAAYADKHARIGQAHVRVGLALRYMVTAMSRVRAALQEIAAQALAADPERSRAVSAAVARVSDLDLAIMLESYKDDFVRRVDRGRAREAEQLRALGAGLAHEIRNPLNGASLHLSVLDRALARSPEVSPQAREAAEVLRAEIKRLSALVSDFLEVARPKPLARVQCDVNDIARDVGTLVAPEADSRRVALRVDSFPLPATAMVDPDRVRQILLNLVRNGIEAVAEGGHVAILVRQLSEAVEIDVADDGDGIPDAAAPIFDAFYTTKERGTGLGLSIVHRIVSDHGGDVRFESRPGLTVFTVRLPARPARSLL